MNMTSEKECLRRMLNTKEKRYEFSLLKQLTPFKNVHSPIKYQYTYFNHKYTITIVPNRKYHIKHLNRQLYSVLRFQRRLTRIEKSTGEYGHIKQLTPYKSWDSVIYFKCLDCGRVYQRLPKIICDKSRPYYICKNKIKQSRFNKYKARWYKRLIQFEKKSGEYGHIKELTPYKGSRKPIYFKCLDCGQISKLRPDYLNRTRSHICKNKLYNMSDRIPKHRIKTSKRSMADLKSERRKHFEKRLISKEKQTGEYGYIKQLTPYVSYNKPIKFFCLKHHKIFHNYSQFIFSKTCKRVCRYAGRALRRKRQSDTLPMIKKKLNNLYHGEYVYVSGKYKSRLSRLYFKHISKSCPYYKLYHHYPVFKARVDSILEMESGCPYEHSSYGERDVMRWLKQYHLISNQDYEYPHICKYHPYTDGYLHLDFYFPNLRFDKNRPSIAIEFNGVQHYKPAGLSDKKLPVWEALSDFNDLRYRDFSTVCYCTDRHIKLFYINNHKDFNGKKLKRMVFKYMNKHILPILKRNHVVK